MRLPAALGFSVVTLAACSSVVVRPRNALVSRTQKLDPPINAQTLYGGLSTIIAAYQESPETYPQDRLLQKLVAPSLVTLSYVVSDLGQWVIDQGAKEKNPWVWRALQPPGSDGSVPVISDDVCAAAAQPQLSNEVPADRFLTQDEGNPPDLRYEPVWFPVVRRPDLNRANDATSPLLDDATCPAGKDATYVCLHGRLALRPERAPLVILVPGLFQSSSFHQMRNAAAVLYSVGMSVLIIDQRAHGATLAAQPSVATTLGVYEGRDLVAVADALRARDGCAGYVKRVGLLGFSAGGTSVLRAFMDDRKAASTAGQLRFDGGVLAVSPVLDWGYTLRAMSSTGSKGQGGTWSIFDLGAINQLATAFLFMELLRTHLETIKDAMNMSGPPATKIDPINDYLKKIPDKPIEPPYEVITPARLAADFAALPAPGSGSANDYAPYAVIVTSGDDAVVGPDTEAKLVKALQKRARSPFGMEAKSKTVPVPLAIFHPQSGGHIAFAVVSNSLARRLLRYFYLHN
jgi:pimeloyl-ACP methyl ester carboxylesterase